MWQYFVPFFLLLCRVSTSDVCSECLENDFGPNKTFGYCSDGGNFTGCVEPKTITVNSTKLPCGGACAADKCITDADKCPKDDTNKCIGGRDAKACWENYMIYILAAAGGLLLLIVICCCCRRHRKGRINSWLANERAQAQKKHIQLEENSRARHAERGDRTSDIRNKYGLGSGSSHA